MRLGYAAKQSVDAARALRIYTSLRTHDRWSRQRLADHQQKSLTALLQHAVRRSPFYRELYAGLAIDETTTVEQLPVIDKKTLMQNYERVVTDRRLELANLQDHIRQLKGDEHYLGEYRALSTSGTTGSPGVFVYNRREWSTVLANALRWYDYIGVQPRLPRRRRVTAIGSGDPIHVSVRMVESGNIGLFAHQRLTVDTPLDELVAALNAFRPDVLLPYPSIGAMLAEEQLADRLAIDPGVVATHTEELTAEVASKMERAWGSRPFNHYGTTEAPTIGAECDLRRGLHLFADLFIVEVVDEHNRPVAPGETGQKLLLTNLYNYSQPIIRYEISDMLTMAAEPCPCGRPFPLIAGLGGRSEDVIRFPGTGDREVAVPPIAFENALDDEDAVDRYQVVNRRDGLYVRVMPAEGVERNAVTKAVTDRLVSMLTSLGAQPPPVHVDFVTDIARPKTIGSKMKLVVSEQDETGG